MRPSRVLLLAAACAVALGMSGCAADTPTVTVSQPAPSAVAATPPAATTRPTATPTPGADAAALRAFDAIAHAVVRRDSHAGGRAFVDALIAAGYPRSTLQLTPDHTSIGLPAPSVEFSALRDGVCLIGQYGPDSGGYHGIAAAPVDSHCLIGTTRAITW